jgi:transcriptional regulator with XRE-family HTH domain
MRVTLRKTIVKNQSSHPAKTNEPNLGDCLRKLRFERKLSLTDVSTLTGISKSTLSRVESDQLSLTYEKLLQLCRGLQIDLVTLLDPAQGSTRQLGRRAFTQPGQGRDVTVNLVTYSYLCTDLAGKKMTPMTTVIRSGKLTETNGLFKHEGEEFMYVLEGTIELHTEFYETLVLSAGGSVYFDGTMGHGYTSIGDTPAKILCVCLTPEPVLLQALDGPSASSRAEAVRLPPRRQRQK